MLLGLFIVVLLPVALEWVLKIVFEKVGGQVHQLHWLGFALIIILLIFTPFVRRRRPFYGLFESLSLQRNDLSFSNFLNFGATLEAIVELAAKAGHWRLRQAPTSVFAERALEDIIGVTSTAIQQAQ